MKKQILLLSSALFVIGMSMTSCSGGKGCKGGGWYGDRNLTYSPTPETEIQQTYKIEEIKVCEDVNP